MRRAISLVIVAGSLAVLASAQSSSASPDNGALAGKRYVNGYFGFSYRFPEGWKASAVTRSTEANRAPTKFYALFSASPSGEAGDAGNGGNGSNDVRYISIQADAAPASLRNPRDFMNASLRSLVGPGGAFQALHNARAEYGGREFFRQDLRSRPAPGGPQFLETQLVTVERGYGVTLSFIAASKDDLEDLVRSAESLEFFAPGTMPEAPAEAIAVAKAAMPAPVQPAAAPHPDAKLAMQPAAESAPETVTVVVTASTPASSTVSPTQTSVAQAKTEVASAKADSAAPAPVAVTADAHEDSASTEGRAAAVAQADIPIPKSTTAKASDQVAVIAEPLPQQMAVQPQAAQVISPAPKPAPKAEPVRSDEVAVETPARGESRDPFARESAVETAGASAPPLAMGFAPRVPTPAAPQSLSEPLYASGNLRSVVVESVPAPRNAFVAMPAPAPQTPVVERVPASPAMVARAEVPAQQLSAPPARLKISAVSFESYIVREGRMVYPELARAERVQGDVVIRVVVNTAGHLTDIRALSGPTLLRQGALEAVKSWAFKPYLVNGAPVEVESEISVAFRLAQ